MNFKQHITFGIVIGVGFSLIFLHYEGLSWLFIFPLLLAILGSVLPDIDHHASVPFKILKILVFLLFFFCCLGTVIEHDEILNTITKDLSTIFPINVSSETIKFFASILIALTAGILSVILLKISKPAHRGVTHKKMFGISLGFLLFLFFYLVFSHQNFSIITTLSFITGFFSHLALDKILLKI